MVLKGIFGKKCGFKFWQSLVFLCAGLLIIFTNQNAKAQLNNQAFEDRNPIQTTDSGRVKLTIQNFDFFKNNEYFNKIADGYTLFGYHLNPRISYQINTDLLMEAGGFFWKDFGNPNFKLIQPTFTVKYKRKNQQVLFGTLEGNLQHRLIEPLQDFESVINNRLENGMQYQLQEKNLWLDAWVNWRQMIYPFSDKKEEISGGFNCVWKVLEAGNFKASIPLQFVAYHKGGQIDTLAKIPLQTLFNTAPGLILEQNFKSTSILRGIKAESYFTTFSDNSFEKRLSFSSGNGLYINLTFQFRAFDFMLSHWKGNGFISPFGGRLYQSTSGSVKNAGYLEKKREILILRIMKDVKIYQDCWLTLRFEPLIDMHTGTFEFSHAVYFNLKKSFFLTSGK